ncbi:hypothetical protein TIFTF001_044506 [Ficus carica]|uniref:Retrotransposon gag domain-containing protein n=1 Tax=Ficus carica TaxID=3494 RepID=A0AA87ZPU3_FICCA|nr:hypothetical protein TIFTF001_044506 [Ficus carica]
MARPRTRANPNPQEPDLANIVVMLQQQLLEQQQETNRLQEQIAQLNRIPRANVVPPQENPVPTVVPQVSEVHQEIPRNAGVLLAPVRVQVNPPLIREDLLYERFRRMKAPEFEGLADPIEVDNWLIDIQVIFDFMGLSEQEKVLCASFTLKKDARHWWMTVQMCRNMTTMSWQDFVTEFRTMYYNREILAAQQDEFNSFRQGSMTVMEAVKKFEQLARLCPELVPNETEKVRRMMKMFRTDIAKQVSAGSNPPTLVSDCISRVIRAEYWINQDKEAMAQIFKAKKEEKAIVKHPQPRQNPEFYSNGQSSNVGQNTRQFMTNKRKGNVMSQSQQRSYPQKKVNRVKIEGPSLAQGTLEAPEPQAQIYAYTKGDVEAGTSSVVTGQISITTYNALALLDSGVTNSFVLKEFAQKLGRRVDSLEQPFRTSLTSGEIL